MLEAGAGYMLLLLLLPPSEGHVEPIIFYPVLSQLDRTLCTCGPRGSVVGFIWVGLLSTVPNVPLFRICDRLNREESPLRQSRREHTDRHQLVSVGSADAVCYVS